MKSPVNIAIFASGSGTNAENLALYFKDHKDIKVKLIVCNKQGAGVIQRAERLQIPVKMIDRAQWQQAENLVKELQKMEIDFIVLAGFLWLIPVGLIRAFPNKIINIHPALLPKYGGKGMYGSNVHEAVKQNRETETGITIHFVNEEYDRGETIFQQTVPVNPDVDTPETIASRVHELEYQFFPRVVEEVILGRI